MHSVADRLRAESRGDLSRRTPAERVVLALGGAIVRAPSTGGTPAVPMSRGADRLSLLAPVTEILRSRSIPFALIGAAAMAVHGISRSTRDLDLFTLARECLESSTWAPLARAGIEARLRLGDTDDPLAGVARFTAAGDDPVDLIVGKHRWQVGSWTVPGRPRLKAHASPSRAPPTSSRSSSMPAAPRDAWDIEQLLGAADGAAIAAAVERLLPDMPDKARALWTRIRGGR